MSGVPPFTEGEIAVLTVAAGLAKDVAASVIAYAPNAAVEEVYNDLSAALNKLGRMQLHLVSETPEGVNDGTTDSV